MELGIGRMKKVGEMNIAWGGIRVVLEDTFSFYNIKRIVGLSGLDVTLFGYLQQKQQNQRGGASKGQLISEIDRAISSLSTDDKAVVLVNIIKNIIDSRPEKREELGIYLERLGWQFAEGKLLPIKLLDISELDELPEAATSDLIKAAERLRYGDLDGALTSSCAAVDSTLNSIFLEEGLVLQPSDGFLARYKKALKAKNTLNILLKELTELGWDEKEAKLLIKNLDGSLNQGAYAMQTLRKRMGDVHGSKPVLKSLVFDSLKWAEIMLRMLK